MWKKNLEKKNMVIFSPYFFFLQVVNLIVLDD